MRELAQSMVEAVVVVPLCILCAVVLVESGVIVRDRVVTAQAATRAAEAHQQGRDPEAAAHGVLPRKLAETLEVQVHENRRIRVHTRSAPAILGATSEIRHQSDVVLEAATEEKA